MSTLLMCKNIPVLEILESGNCKVLKYELLPVNIRKKDVNIEDYYSEWITNRALSISRTNAKAILNSLRLSQTNRAAICKACHAVNLFDAYWIKEKNESITWDDINLFHNDFSKSLAITALTGKTIRENGKIHTPELTTQGVSAKAWWHENGGLYLYKVGRKELAASKILDALKIDHVKYEEVVEKDLQEVMTKERRDSLKEQNEKVVKCKLISSEEKSMVTFEEFMIYCEYHEKNPFEEVLKIDAKHYYEMQVADYIISNDDRHIGNWGFFMDSGTGCIEKLYPLLDHDHAFSKEEDIIAQTTEKDTSLLYAAIEAQLHVNIEIQNVLNMEKPDFLEDDEWNQVQNNVRTLSDQFKGHKESMKNR